MGTASSASIERLRLAMHAARDTSGDGAGYLAWIRACADYYVALHPEDARWRLIAVSEAVPSVDEIRARAAVADRAHHAIPSNGRLDPRPGRRDAWAAQVGWAWETHGGVFTERFSRAVEAVRAGDRTDLEYCVRFLEADPWCQRSGYVKDVLVPAVARLELDAPTGQRLAEVVIRVVDDPRPRREIRRYGALAQAVVSPDLRARIEGRLGASDPQVRYNARQVLSGLG